MAVKILFCYAREDETLLNKLKTHLKPLQRQGLIEVWHDRDISAGSNWEREISTQLNKADLILLLLSPDFMDSDYCYGVEMKRAIERHERGETVVIPIILRHVYWQVESLGKLQALPIDAKPIIDRYWNSLDEAFFNVTEGIYKAARKLIPEMPQTGKENVIESSKERRIGKTEEAETRLVQEDIHLASSQATPASTTYRLNSSQEPEQEELSTNRTVKSEFVYALPSRKNIVCPFCFSSVSPKEMHFRCLSPFCRGRDPDNIYATSRGIQPTPMGHVLVPTMQAFKQPRVVRCDLCLSETSTRICPVCHFDFPHDIDQADQLTLAIIGGTNSGKSHYITSLIMRLKDEIGKLFGISVLMLDDNTKAFWERNYYSPMVEQRTVLRPTPPGTIDVGVRVPLIFRLTLNNGASKRAINISIYDTAGDDMISLDTLTAYAPCIWHADAIIFLLDPLQINTVRQQLPGVNVVSYNPKAAPEYIIGRLRTLFERQKQLRVDKRIKTPIAFTLAKIDMLFPLLDPASALKRPGATLKKLDIAEVQSISTEIASYLSDWINPNFCDIVNDNFDNYHYFGVSSLGKQPDSNNRLGTISPLRVEDPFLWILFKFGLIKGL